MKYFVNAALALILGCGIIRGAAAQAPYIPTAPKSPLLASAKTVYIASEFMADFADSDKAYDQIYASVQKMNRFTIVLDPSAADLILDFSYSSIYPPFVVLTVLDGKSHVPLWTVRGPGIPKGFPGCPSKPNAPDVVERLLDYLKIITTPK